MSVAMYAIYRNQAIFSLHIPIQKRKDFLLKESSTCEAAITKRRYVFLVHQFHPISLYTIQVGKRLIAAKQPASFLAISATYVNHGSGFVAPSAAAKSGVETLYQSLASEWSQYGMRFNVLAPGKRQDLANHEIQL